MQGARRHWMGALFPTAGNSECRQIKKPGWTSKTRSDPDLPGAPVDPRTATHWAAAVWTRGLVASAGWGTIHAPPSNSPQSQNGPHQNPTGVLSAREVTQSTGTMHICLKQKFSQNEKLKRIMTIVPYSSAAWCAFLFDWSFPPPFNQSRRVTENQLLLWFYVHNSFFHVCLANLGPGRTQ